MITLIYAPVFVKQLKNLEPSLQDEVLEKIDVFKNKDNYKILKVHKLHGKFADRFSFSVNYNTRIIFKYLKKNEVALLFVGDHDLYK